MAEYYHTPNTASGIPKYYGNWDAEFWVVAPTPNAQFSITLAYIKQPSKYNNTTQPTAAPAATMELIYLINIKIYFYMHVW